MHFSKLMVAALGCFAGLALAESQVSVYGQLSEGVVVAKNKKTSTRVSLDDSDSGITYIGINGLEDLGGGNQIGFILESGFNIDTGSYDVTTPECFTREAQLYVKGNWGRLGFGRLGNIIGPQFSTGIGSGWVFWDGVNQPSSAYPAIITNTTSTRVSNAVDYQSPVFGGLQLHMMYSNGISTDDNNGKWSKNSHYYAAGLLYSQGNIRSSLAYEFYDWKGPGDFGSDFGSQHVITFGAEYTIADWTPMFTYQYSTTQHDYRVHLFGLSAQTNVAGGLFRAGVRYIFGKNVGENFPADTNKVTWLNGALGYDYPLSKRTTVYTLGSYAYGGKAFGEDYFTKSIAGNWLYSGYQISVGLTHRF